MNVRLFRLAPARASTLFGLTLVCSCASQGETVAKTCADPGHHHHESTNHSALVLTDGDPSETVPSSGSAPVIIPHDTLKAYGNNGNSLVGIATASLGSTNIEVWRSSIAPGGKTPLHRHSSEEIFIILTGEGEFTVGSATIPFQAPATVIAPAGLVHQVHNTGHIPTDQIVIVPVDSRIYDTAGTEMPLPWRK